MNEQEFANEWAKYTINLPPEEYDEDDVLNEKLEAIERRQRQHINRGDFFAI